MCLREKFKNIDKNNLFLFSLVIFILPSFRSGAIWPNTQVTALVFFLASLYNFVKWQNLNNYKTINNSLLYSIFFMSMAVYSRQLYALIFLYYVYIFFLNYNFKKFFQVSLLIFFLAVPGIYFVFQNPNIAAVTFNASLYNSLLVNSSIISFYLIPFFVILLIDKKLGINFQNRNYFYIPVLSLIIVVVLAQSFNYNFRMGGGYFIKLSILLFDNLYFFYLSSIIGFICILSLIKKNFLILFLLIFGFSSWLIFQKYFEPMFLILLFLIFQTSLTRKFLESKRNIMAYLFFIGLYFLTALANNLFKITGTI